MNMRSQPPALIAHVFITLYCCSRAKTSYTRTHSFFFTSSYESKVEITHLPKLDEKLQYHFLYHTYLCCELLQVKDLQYVSWSGLKRHQFVFLLHCHYTHLHANTHNKDDMMKYQACEKGQWWINSLSALVQGTSLHHRVQRRRSSHARLPPTHQQHDL